MRPLTALIEGRPSTLQAPGRCWPPLTTRRTAHIHTPSTPFTPRPYQATAVTEAEALCPPWSTHASCRLKTCGRGGDGVNVHTHASCIRPAGENHDETLDRSGRTRPGLRTQPIHQDSCLGSRITVPPCMIASERTCNTYAICYQCW